MVSFNNSCTLSCILAGGILQYKPAMAQAVTLHTSLGDLKLELYCEEVISEIAVQSACSKLDSRLTAFILVRNDR